MGVGMDSGPEKNFIGINVSDAGYSVLIQRPPMGQTYEGYPVVAREIAQSAAIVPVVLAFRKNSRNNRRLEIILDICKAHWPSQDTPAR